MGYLFFRCLASAIYVFPGMAPINLIYENSNRLYFFAKVETTKAWPKIIGAESIYLLTIV